MAAIWKNNFGQLLVCFALAGCASPPQAPAHQWVVAVANVDHLPLNGLPTPPRVVAEERPIVLVNLDNEAERDSKRATAAALGAAGGAVYGGLMTLGHLGLACIVLPPLCVAGVAVGAAAGHQAASVVPISAEEAGRFAAVFREHASTAQLLQLTAARLPAAGEEADELRLHVLGVVMVPRKEGVTFRLAAQAQGCPRGKPEWKPSIHFVPFATRTVEEWLASDAKLLKSEVHSALLTLSASIAPSYMPYRHR